MPSIHQMMSIVTRSLGEKLATKHEPTLPLADQWRPHVRADGAKTAFEINGLGQLRSKDFDPDDDRGTCWYVRESALQPA